MTAGVAAANAGDLARAEECFEAALAEPGIVKHSGSGMTWLNLGAVRRLLGDKKGAVVAFRRALSYEELPPHHRSYVETSLAELEEQASATGARAGGGTAKQRQQRPGEQ